MPDTLEERFWELARKRLANGNVALQERSEVRFRNLLRSGVAKMQGGGVAEDPVQLELADTNLLRLVEGMIREAQERELVSVSRSIYDFAIGRNCPAWPFC